ncbi:MAG: galactose oxidase-like domain-containing protein [Rhodospirillales bacterium]
MTLTCLKFGLALTAFTLVLGVEWQALAASSDEGLSDDDAVFAAHEANQPGRFDYGYGVGVRPPKQAPVSAAAVVGAAAVPPGNTQAPTKGVFGGPVTWPIIPLHVALLPDGRVFNFGSTEDGKQGGFVYDLWDPSSGTGPASHTTLPTRPGGTLTDIFCAGQALIGSNRLLITGGDLTVGGERNHSIADTEVFDWNNDNLTSAQSMQFARWYPTIVPTPNGERVVLGGRQDFKPGATPESPKNEVIGAPLPEVYTEGLGRRTLTNAGNDFAYGVKNWFYPRGFQVGNGKILIVNNSSGKMFYLNPAGTGQINGIAPKARTGAAPFPTLMYGPGKILSVRMFQKVDLIDATGALPVVTAGPDTDQVRYWSNTTLMADGRVLLNGGSAVGNKDVNSALKAQIWDPASPNQWSDADSAQKIRLYHSTALLLPDATVLTAAGGDPGPVKNLNAEIYYPPYLYNGDGTPATRPAINSAPAAFQLGQPFSITVSGGPITRVTLLRVGSATHSINVDQRFFDLAFSGTGPLTVTPPSNINYALPGYYMLFVFNSQGVPSVAKFLYLS